MFTQAWVSSFCKLSRKYGGLRINHLVLLLNTLFNFDYLINTAMISEVTCDVSFVLKGNFYLWQKGIGAVLPLLESICAPKSYRVRLILCPGGASIIHGHTFEPTRAIFTDRLEMNPSPSVSFISRSFRHIRLYLSPRCTANNGMKFGS